MIALCAGCHAKVHRTKAVLTEFPPLLLVLWREQHPEGHEQTYFDFNVRKPPPEQWQVARPLRFGSVCEGCCSRRAREKAHPSPTELTGDQPFDAGSGVLEVGGLCEVCPCQFRLLVEEEIVIAGDDQFMRKGSVPSQALKSSISSVDDPFTIKSPE
jgi:hypothetical protein